MPKAEEVKIVKSVADAIPSWPEGDWLPKDWRVAYRQLPQSLHKVFIPPGQEEGFCYHRSSVQAYLTDGTSLTPMSTSRPAVLKLPDGEVSKRRKTSGKGKAGEVATADDFQNVGSFVVLRLPGPGTKEAVAAATLVEAGASEVLARQLVRAGEELHGMLVRRGFREETELQVVFSTSATSTSSTDGAAQAVYADLLRGIYYQLPERVNGRPCYQQAKVEPTCYPGVACLGLYLSWDQGWPGGGCWRLGGLPGQHLGVAIWREDHPRPGVSSAEPWRVLRLDFPGLRLTPARTNDIDILLE